MIKKYSIAEARDKFAAIVHDLERVSHIELTRRGEPVAVLLSVKEYQRMNARQRPFWQAYTEFRERFPLRELNISPEIFNGTRDKEPGREVYL